MGRLEKAVPVLKERAHTFQEARNMIEEELSCLFLRPSLVKETLVEKSPESDPSFTKKALKQFLPILDTISESDTAEDLKTALMPLADANPKDMGGRGAVLWPLRYALSGQERSPDPFSLVYILGKEESILRIKEALTLL